MTPITFRKFRAGDHPAPGELWVRAVEQEDRARREVALLVLTHGLEALQHGPGTAERIVVDAGGVQPTFDEMLAAHIAALLLAGREVPAGFHALAQYARQVRKGLSPGPAGLPLEETLEGIYTAVRNLAGDDLTDPDNARQFLASWRRLSERLTQAVERGESVYERSLFAADATFAEERAYLRRDEEVYRQDVERGERWLVHLPDGPPVSAGLLLRQPKSFAFPYWSRRDPKTATGSPYLFLMVDWGGNQWVFSTDPIHRLSLKPLAKLLQAAEKTRDPARAARDPWYDGKDKAYSLAASPREGTCLAEAELLAIVRKWAAVAPVTRWRTVALRTMNAASVLLLVACTLILTGSRKSTDGVTEAREGPEGPRAVQRVWPTAEAAFFHQEVRLEDKEPRTEFSVWNRKEARKPVDLFVDLVGLKPDLVEGTTVQVTLNGARSKSAALAVREGRMVVPPIEEELEPGDNKVQVAVAHPERKVSVDVVRLVCRDRANIQAHLHVLTMGVSRYAKHHAVKKTGGTYELNLKYADRDAEELARCFQAQQGLLFRSVQCQVLTNQKATANNIRDALNALVKQLQGPRVPGEYHLAVVAFAGHGEKARETGGEFFFLPHDYDPDQLLDNTAVSAAVIRRYLNSLPCPVILILDACHAGAISTSGERGPADVDPKTVRDAIDKLGQTKKSLILIAACTGDQTAREDEKFDKHGALTYFVLQALRGKGRQPEAGEVLYLDELRARVEEQMKRSIDPNQQALAIHATGDISFSTIPVAAVPKVQAAVRVK